MDYDGVKLVEVDGGGTVVDAAVEAGYQITIGNEWMTNGDFENGTTGWTVFHTAFQLKQTSYNGSWCMTVEGADKNHCRQYFTPDPHTWFKFSCWAKGGASIAPAMGSITLGTSYLVIDHDYSDPYIPAGGWHKKEYFFYVDDKSDWSHPDLAVQMLRYTGAVDDVSLRECEVRFVLNADSAGSKRYMLYYSPLEGRTTKAPDTVRQTAFPGTALPVSKDGATEWLNEGITYTLVSDTEADVWYASTMRKVLKDAPAPTVSSSKISIACARNESEAMQIV